MEIPLNARVECTDGVCGCSQFVLINPVIDNVTHLVVRGDASPYTDYLVPIEFVKETNADTIRLRCSIAELEKMEKFFKTAVIEERVPDMRFNYSGGTYYTGSFFYLPFVTPTVTLYDSVTEKQIPPGELVLRRSTRVEAIDGYVGKIDEFVVNRQNGHITHLVMREGHLWGKKDVIIPLSAVGDTRKDTVFLKIDKQQVESLPTFPLKRRWS